MGISFHAPRPSQNQKPWQCLDRLGLMQLLDGLQQILARLEEEGKKGLNASDLWFEVQRPDARYPARQTAGAAGADFMGRSLP
jgi:hypothetical protein